LEEPGAKATGEYIECFAYFKKTIDPSFHELVAIPEYHPGACSWSCRVVLQAFFFFFAHHSAEACFIIQTRSTCRQRRGQLTGRSIIYPKTRHPDRSTTLCLFFYFFFFFDRVLYMWPVLLRLVRCSRLSRLYKGAAQLHERRHHVGRYGHVHLLAVHYL
jgi:hypothetical protein